MDSAESAHVLEHYAKHYRAGMVDFSISSPSDSGPGDDHRLSYAPPLGLPALREAIAALYPGLGAKHIVVTNGASEALAATAFALVRPGHRVSAGPEVYPSFRETAIRLGAVLSAENPSVTVINNPIIPDGRLVALQPLIASVEAAGGQLVADEVYLDLRADAPGTPAASLSTAAISIGDLSKPLGLGGLRIGWAACQDPSVVEAIGRSVQLLSGGPSVLAMEAGLAAVRDYGPRLDARCAAAAKNASLVFAVLEEAGWAFRPPEAGWTFLARPPEPLRPSQLRTLAADGYFLVPSSVFGVPGGYRISVFAPAQSLRSALRSVSSLPVKQGSLVVLARSTQPGLGKTRLARDLASGAASELAGAFLQDTVELARASGHDLTVAFTPCEARTEFASVAPGATLVAQPAGDLGDRLAAALDVALCGRNSAVLIGSDTPQLPGSVIDDAFRHLKRADLVVGPATDGGFYLIGLREAGVAERLFEGIEWSTPRVFGQLIQNALQMELTFEVLEELTDIDDVEGLAVVLREAVSSGAAPQTRAAAARLGLGAV